ncbi:Ig-like domain-containing protein [Glaciecola sp. 1036]|uniref:Ig-like domain-containing protein n=1 Tax=Alteromonadaceae TaxID=72275 RepID=UPI003D070C19
MKHCIRTIWFTLLLGMLMACGGGGEPLSRSETGTPTPDPGATPQTLTLALSLVDADGNTASEVSDGSPLTLLATVTNQDGNPVSNKVVTFTFDKAGLARFGNDAGSALTGTDGIARIAIYVDDLSGSANITASVDSTVTESIGFTSAGSQQQQPTAIELFADKVQLPSSGNDTVVITAIVKNDNNILLSDIPVSFAVNNNASLTVVDSVTGEDGAARARLSTQNNPENRTITVTANAANLNQTLDIKVVGTEILVNGPSSIIINDVSPLTIVVSDSDGRGIPNTPVSISSDIGTISNPVPADADGNPMTDSSGQVSVDFSSSQAGNAAVTASALNTNIQFRINIQQDDFSFSSVPSEDIPLGDLAPLEIRWFKNGLPYANGNIEVTSSRGNITVGGNPTNVTTTDAFGVATVHISSSFAGPASISAIGTDGNGQTVSARTSIEFIATVPHSVSVDATPDLIGPEGQTSTFTAIVRDQLGNLVKGAEVDFTIVTDDTGGSISPNRATTDSNGIASTVYTSNAVSSQDGVLIRAATGGVTGDAYLTVGDRAFDISLGTGTIIQKPDNSTYLKEFAVFVTDAAGRPVANAELTASANPTMENAYRKGYWNWDANDRIWVLYDTNPLSPTYLENTYINCPSEDFIIRNNRLDAGEDRNGDGQLTPGNVAVVSFKDGVSRTNEFGQATIEVRYPRQFAPWVKLEIVVSGQSSGTEASESQFFTLSVAAEELKAEGISPPNSPFGQSLLTCFNTD